MMPETVLCNIFVSCTDYIFKLLSRISFQSEITVRNIIEQKIAVYYSLDGENETALLHAIFLARLFKREVCLLHPVKESKQRTTINQILSKKNRELMERYSDVVFGSLTPKGTLSEIQEELGAEWDVVLFIAERKLFSKLQPALKEASIPFLFVTSKNNIADQYERVYLPVDYRREIKDCGIWASYFARFNDSNVNLCLANERGAQELRVKNNTASIKKLFRTIGHSISEHSTMRWSWYVNKATVRKAEGEYALFIILGSRYDSLIDVMIGTPEKRILRHTESNPVLFINPRKDMFVMCN